MTTPPPAGGPSGAPAGGPRAVPPKPVHPPRAPRLGAYVPGDGVLAWLPFRPTIRMRLTLLYGGMFLMAGVVLLMLMYFFFNQALDYVAPPTLSGFTVVNGSGAAASSAQLNDILASRHQAAANVALNTLLRKSLTMLVCLAVIAFVAGYAMAGRVLRPLGRITRTARDVASSDLHRRIELDGPDDELKELADTFDEMLDRLDRSFDSQRRFVANASHELRTPLAINRTLLEVQLSDPAASQDLQQLGKTLLATNERSEQLVEGLLLLARSENELTDRRPVELSEVATRALEQTRGEAGKREVELRSKLDPAVVAGNGVLLERLALNLLQNAVRYNTAGGWVELATTAVPGGGELVVSNTGPVVPGYELEHIFEPFRRIKGADRTRSDKGVGLGLSIVRSVVRAHGGTIEATPRAGGGLTMRVRIPTP
ncbi:cell wall metabolism sensor histidine kinase WalK [Kitasatospora sp. SUK 42]|uniref:sensor histidine kinase n=1 Tax=Kitasatospora sp. SUK 42 TaxID=1588882 RepID=UPI0018CA5603|nr:HAMP domain-containing sensor histidine kinase [Kitasatospora sp. SUK 42]MBV2151601.1 HAMP domain-containing histidine kinase [Kitasatospora sp. SUK 42]